MEFIRTEGPHFKDTDNTSKIMTRLLIALLPIIIFAIYKNGFFLYQKGYITIYEAFYPLLLILTAGLTSVLTEGLYLRFGLKQKGEQFKSVFKHSYALFPGLFLALILPLNTPLWCVIFGSIVATLLGKMLFGGFGHNIFNPALIGALFVTHAYGPLLVSRGGYLNQLEIDTIAGATPLTNLSNLNYLGSYETIISPFGSLWHYFSGFIPGALGETSKILIILAFIYLVWKKVIKWQIPFTYVATVLVMSFIIGIYNDMSWWFPLMQVLSGGLLFGAVFMATDPVTSPVSKMGQVYYGIGLGILTVVFRFLTSYPEGVLTAILTMNMLVIIIDRIGARVRFNFKKALLYLTILVLGGFLITIYITYNLKPKTKIQDDVIILAVEEQGAITTYHVTSKGFAGLIEAEIIMTESNLSAINIIKQNESYWGEVVNNDYLDQLIKGQNQLAKVDTISGATKTTSSLKLMVERVLSEHENK